MKLELNQDKYTLQTYYNIIEEFAYRMEDYDDAFLTFCWEQAKNEVLEQRNVPASQYEGSFARVIIEAAELFEEQLSEDMDEDDWNALFQEVE